MCMNSKDKYVWIRVATIKCKNISASILNIYNRKFINTLFDEFLCIQKVDI